MILHLLLLVSHIKRQVKSIALFYMPCASYLRVSGFYCLFCVSTGTQNWNSPFQQCYFIAWLFKLLSLNRQNTDTITREHSSSRSERADLWVGKCHWNCSGALVPDQLAFKHCSPIVWEGCVLCAPAPLAGPKLPLLLLCKECPSLLQGGKRTIEWKVLLLLSSCVGAAWLQARAACTGLGKLSAYWCWAGRAGLLFWKLSKSWYSGCAEMPFAGGRKGLAVWSAAGVWTSWAQ